MYVALFVARHEGRGETMEVGQNYIRSRCPIVV